MKLIIVRRSKTETYRRLLDKFADDHGVKVILERRTDSLRDEKAESLSREERRRLRKAFEQRDYVVIHRADENRART